MYGLAGLLFDTLFGSQEGRQQQHGASQETAPQDSPVASQGYAQADTETAETGAHTSDAHRSAEVSLAEDTADTDGAARYDQTAYGRPSNRPATRAGFAPGMEDKALQCKCKPNPAGRAFACVLQILHHCHCNRPKQNPEQ